jgi:hypothetical protein
MLYKTIITQKYAGKTALGPTSSRDEASRLARSWMEAMAGLISGSGGRQADPVTNVAIKGWENGEPVDDDEE